jgi:uncharacterized protein YecE (DUF72 family)
VPQIVREDRPVLAENLSPASEPVHLANARIYIGTSGWHYKHWVGDFYPSRFAPEKMLAWYSREFPTVEINNSFYRLPEARIFARWRGIVPAGFLFAVKASRFLTHIKRLKDPEDPVRLFFSRAENLGAHLGPVLFQLPPGWKADVGRLREFLYALSPWHRNVIEFRDESWYTREICELLRQHNVALCLHDWRSAEWSQELTANFAYIRFHGTTGKYAGNYPEYVLQSWAKQINTWSSNLREVYAYFNNDVGGHAVRNAATLRDMLQNIAATHSEARDVA